MDFHNIKLVRSGVTEMLPIDEKDGARMEPTDEEVRAPAVWDSWSWLVPMVVTNG